MIYDVGDDDYEHIVQQAELVREKQHWDGIKKAQMEKVYNLFYIILFVSDVITG